MLTFMCEASPVKDEKDAIRVNQKALNRSINVLTNGGGYDILVSNSPIPILPSGLPLSEEQCTIW